MPKNIVLFIDGTGNDGDNAQRQKTNVKKLHEACTESKKCYLRGVGTGNKIDHLAGGAFGFGIEKKLRTAYEFLVNDYQDGDNIFLLGFSRGAFAARTLAGFLGRFGTLFRWPLDKAQIVARGAQIFGTSAAGDTCFSVVCAVHTTHTAERQKGKQAIKAAILACPRAVRWPRG